MRALLVVTGASGSGKTSVFHDLASQLRSECIVFDADWLIDPFGGERSLQRVVFGHRRPAHEVGRHLADVVHPMLEHARAALGALADRLLAGEIDGLGGTGSLAVLSSRRAMGLAARRLRLFVTPEERAEAILIGG